MTVRKNHRKAVLRLADREAVDNRQRSVRVALRPLQAFLMQVREELRLGEAAVTIGLVSDAEIARMNESFRKKKGPTDVLSFPRVARRGPRRSGLPKRKPLVSPAASGQSPGAPCTKRAESEYLGDIAIAPATARRYARKNGRSLSSELRVLILHGVLHLLGYDHETDRGEMERVERKLRKRLGLA
jgi:probable rRNA maturation factor